MYKKRPGARPAVPDTVIEQEGDDHDESQPVHVRIRECQLQGLDPGELDINRRPKRPVPKGYPMVPFMAGVFGNRGAGKTYSICKMIKAYDNTASFDKIVIFSPTLGRDPLLQSLQRGKHYRLEVYDHFDAAALLKLVTETSKEIDKYDVYLRAKRAWAELEGGKPIDRLTLEQQQALQSYDYRNPTEAGVYPKGSPSILLVFDDLVGDRSVYNFDGSTEVGRFALRHRHYLISILFSVQVSKGGGGIPRQHRNNLSLAMLFKNKAPKLRREVCEDLCGDIPPEQFEQMWVHATEEKHGFLMVDYSAPHPSLMFRKNLDCFLTVDDFAEGEPEQAVEEVSSGYASSDDENSDSSLSVVEYDSDEENKLFDWRKDERRAKEAYGQDGTLFQGRKFSRRRVPIRKIFGGTARGLNIHSKRSKGGDIKKTGVLFKERTPREWLGADKTVGRR
jgi:hypothetical protein